MASLTGEQLKDTYDSLLKVDDNGSLGGTYKEITDGLGNGSGLYLGTGGNVGIGVSPDSVLHIKDDTSTVYDATALQQDLIIERKNTSGNGQSAHIRFVTTGYEGQTTGEASIGAVQTSNASSADLVFTTRNSGTRAERMRIDSSGNVSITTGNLILDSGAGIDFSDTANSSGTMTSELLDDYEEGTWTPSFSGASYVFTNQSGTYTKIGRKVFVRCKFEITTVGTKISNITFSGLPFTASNSIASGHFIGVVRETETNGAMFVAQVTANSSEGGVNSMDGVTSGDNHIFTTDTYSMAVTYEV